MSTPNFVSQKNHPLYVFDESKFAYYDEDGAFEYFDDCAAQWFYRDIQDVLDGLNDGLDYHKVIIRSGYYCDAQLYVEDTTDWYDIRDIDDDDAMYQYGRTAEEVIADYDSETAAINAWLKENAPALGADEYVCVGIFSNGEAVYERGAREEHASYCTNG